MIRGVVFDLGGVVLGSPLHVISDYERDLALEPGVINRVVMGTGSRGAWSRHERGVIDFETFCSAFNDECRAAGALIDSRRLMARIAAVTAPHPEMLAAVASIRDEGLRVAALTNNWAPLEDEKLKGSFDVVIESSVVGVRKPQPEIYEILLDAIELPPEELVYLDDIGANLKPARALGMRTIKVVSHDQARAELSEVLSLEL